MNTNAKNTVRLFIDEALNRGNVSILNEIVHEKYEYSSPSESMYGIEQLSAFVIALRSAFPNLKVIVKEQIGEASKVWTRVFMTGTH